MNEIKKPPLIDRLAQRYRERRELVEYPFLDWSGRILAFLANLALVASVVIIFRVFSASASNIEDGEKALYAFASMVSGVLLFVLLKGLSSACFLLLDLWKSKKM